MLSLLLLAHCASTASKQREALNYARTAAKSVKSGSSSDLCVFAAEVVKRLIAGQCAARELRESSLELCAWVAPKRECEALLALHLQRIVAQLEAGVEPRVICNASAAVRIHRKPRKSSANGPACELCEGVVEIAAMALQQGWSEEQVTDACKEFCELVSDKKMCGEIVEHYIKTIISRIESGASENEICQSIGYCSSPANSGARIPRVTPRDLKQFRMTKSWAGTSLAKSIRK